MNALTIGLCLLVSLMVLFVFVWSRFPRLMDEEEADPSDRISDLTDDIALLTVEINRLKRQKKRSSHLEAARTAKRNEILRLERQMKVS